jgi:hypothetical protein
MSDPNPLASGSAPLQGYRKTWNVNRKGLSIDRPPANEVLEGTLYYSTDLYLLERSNMVEWETYAVGNPGLGGSIFFYKFDNTSTGANDPGTGLIRMNHTVITSVTEMYFDWLTDDGFDAHLIYMMLNNSTRFIIQDRALAVNYQIWEMTAKAQNRPDWFLLPVRFISSDTVPQLFKNFQKLAVILLPPYATGSL